MKRLEAHPISELFPLMSEVCFNELKKDIEANGLLNPIFTYEGKILDGRNRYRACLELGIEATCVDFDGGNPWKYVWSLNGQRRDLTDTVRYMIWKKCNAGSDEWERTRQGISDQANRKRSEATRQQPRTEDGRRLSGARTRGTRTSKDPDREAKAKASGTNKGAVAKGDIILKDPNLADQVIKGEVKPTEALRQIKKKQVKDKVAALPEGKYRVIYADPPWQYNDARQTGDHRESTGALHHYSTMTQSELTALDIKSLAAPDSVLFCWATLPMLAEALEIIKAWGFKYKTAFVWNKQSGSFGNYHNAEAELLMVATKGSCTPETDQKEKQIQTFKRLGHSRKPDEFRQLIDRLYPQGPRIVLFHRGESPKGWKAWGAEAQ